MGFIVAERKDLAYFGEFGVPGHGYQVGKLKEEISNILGVANLEKVTLYNMEDLDLVIRGNMVERRKEGEKVEKIVKEEVEEFMRKMENKGSTRK